MFIFTQLEVANARTGSSETKRLVLEESVDEKQLDVHKNKRKAVVDVLTRLVVMIMKYKRRGG